MKTVKRAECFATHDEDVAIELEPAQTLFVTFAGVTLEIWACGNQLEVKQITGTTYATRTVYVNLSTKEDKC